MATETIRRCDACNVKLEQDAVSGRYIDIPCMRQPSPGFNPRLYEWVVVTEVRSPSFGDGGPTWIYPDLCQKCFKKAMAKAGVVIDD